jgi:hypothetical protein
VANKGAHERTRVCGKYVYAVICEPRDEPVGIKRNGGHDTAIGVQHGNAVGAKAAAAALPVDYCWTSTGSTLRKVKYEKMVNIRVDHAYLKSACELCAGWRARRG